MLFADIRGFTTIDEQLSTEGVVNRVNMYLSVVADAVVHHDGIVSKSAGDNIMAV